MCRALWSIVWARCTTFNWLWAPLASATLWLAKATPGGEMVSEEEDDDDWLLPAAVAADDEEAAVGVCV